MQTDLIGRVATLFDLTRDAFRGASAAERAVRLFVTYRSGIFRSGDSENTGYNRKSRTMTTKPIRVGGDFGNSQSTLAIPAGRGYRTLTIPSFLGRSSLGELQRMRRGGGHSAILDESATHAGVLTVDGVRILTPLGRMT